MYRPFGWYQATMTNNNKLSKAKPVDKVAQALAALQEYIVDGKLEPADYRFELLGSDQLGDHETLKLEATARDEEVAAEIRDEHANSRYLAGYPLPENLDATSDLEHAAGRSRALSLERVEPDRAVRREAGGHLIGVETAAVVSNGEVKRIPGLFDLDDDSPGAGGQRSEQCAQPDTAQSDDRNRLAGIDIGFEAGGLVEAVEDDKTGLLVPPEDAGEESRLVMHRAAMTEVLGEIAVQERERDRQPLGRFDVVQHRETRRRYQAGEPDHGREMHIARVMLRDTCIAKGSPCPGNGVRRHI